MIRRSWTTVLASVALVGGVTVTAVDAGEVHPAGGPNDRCEKIFAEPNSDLTLQLASMSCCDNSCCAPDGCSENSCCAPLDCCGDGGCDLGCSDGGCGEGCIGLEDESPFNFGGWLQFGYTSDVTPNATAPNDAGSFNNHPDRFNLHQAWLYAERVADGSEGFDWGFRADVVYGVDGPDTQSFGNNPGRFDNGGGFTRGAGFGWAIPQLYGEIANGNLSVKIGHFYTLIGYEVVTAPDNFFFSHSLTFFNSEPFTHTGALATYSVSDDVTLYGGWTAGWDTGFDQVSGGSNFLGGFSVPVGEKATFTYITTIGDFGARSLAFGANSGYSHSLLLDVAVSDSVNVIVQSDNVRTGTNDQVGINSYFIKQINDKLGAGVRAEWWKNEGDSQYAVTYGVNIKLRDNLVIRPEIRHDWHITNGTDPRTSQDVFGIDAVLTF